MRKTPTMLKVVYFMLVVAVLYGVYEWQFGQREGWELGQLALITIIVAIIAAVGIIGNKLSNKNKGL